MELENIRKILAEVVKIDENDIEYDTNLFEEGILDSLAILTLILRLSDEYDVELDLGFIEREDISTVENIYNTISDLRG